MRWFHLSRALAAGTGQSTTLSSLLWMFIFENYSDQSLDRRRRLIGMRLGTIFFIYGMNWSGVLLQIPALIHGLHHMQKLLEFGKACCHFACASVGSTFALLASFRCSTCQPSTTYVGIKASSVLQIDEYWILERSCFG